MDMNWLTYIRRSVKFLAALVVLYAAAMWLMVRMGLTMLTAREMAMNLLLSRRGIILVCVVVLWAVLYPKVGFVVRRIEGDVTDDRERIDNAFVRSGYVPVAEEEGRVTYRAANLFKRLRLLFEDRVTVEQYGQWIVLTGIRRSVAEIEMRLKTYIGNARRNEE